MKVAVFSDVHSNYWILKKSIKMCKNEGISTFIFLGDYITDGFMDYYVLKLIRKYGTYIIRGNREQYILDIKQKGQKNNGYKNMNPLFYTLENLKKKDFIYIKSLLKEDIIKLNGIHILLTHGHNPSINLYDERTLDKLIDTYHFDICLSGHSHIFKSKKYKGKYFMNPGSIGFPLDGPFYSYGILDLDNLSFEKRKIEVKGYIKKISFRYLKSDYYQKNKQWCNLLLNQMNDGRGYIDIFMRNIKISLKKYSRITPAIYNKVWDIEYKKIEKKIIKK